MIRESVGRRGSRSAHRATKTGTRSRAVQSWSSDRPPSRLDTHSSPEPGSPTASTPPAAVARRREERAADARRRSTRAANQRVACGQRRGNDNDRAKKVARSIPRGRLPTGSLHTEAREPAQAGRIKQQLTALVNTQQKLGELKRSTNRNFYEIGELLHRIRDQRLYEVKGYSSFEAYVERETSLGQQFCAQAVRIFETFLPAAAHSLGFSRLAAALPARG